jgi:hypothetical protein
MIYGSDTLRDAMSDEYFSLEEEYIICSPTYTEDTEYINNGKKLRWKSYKLIGRLESLDVYSHSLPGDAARPWIRFTALSYILTNSSLGSLPASGVIGANICGRLSLVKQETRTYILSSQPNGWPPLMIYAFGGRGMVQILIDLGSMSEGSEACERSSLT